VWSYGTKHIAEYAVVRPVNLSSSSPAANACMECQKANFRRGLRAIAHMALDGMALDGMELDPKLEWITVDSRTIHSSKF